MRLLHKQGNIKLRYELRPGTNVIGRSTECDVVLDDPVVSARHCEIVLEENGVLVRDLNSTNGTYLNDIPVTEMRFRVGQRLKLGTFELELEPLPMVSIPKMKPLATVPTQLPDGSFCCYQHSDRAGQARCSGCERYFCLECVHHIRRISGGELHLCPICGQSCDPLPGVEMPTPGASSILGALRDTIRMTWKRP
jgi:pSer/pThr/pTyr-binding forkhead associated (FHA) protein